MDIFNQLDKLQDQIKNKLSSIDDLSQINELKVRTIGKKGELTTILKSLKDLVPEQRKEVGKKANKIRDFILKEIDLRKEQIDQQKINYQIKNDTIDITLPGNKKNVGTKHVLNIIIDDLVSFFRSMGFSVVDGHEIEDDKHNFEMLNIPKGHPARDMQDTFYLTDELLLRSQTSPNQAHTLETHDFSKGPLRMIGPGRVFRRDDDDATHSHQFYQLEGLVVDKDVNMSNLFGILNLTMKHVFGENRDIRFRPSYFPFTEPSVEADVSCFACNGKGCAVCKYTGWIEVLGAGMTHPNVLEAAGVDSKKFSGFAFGMGIDRFAMLKYGINDIRDIYTNDLRFLKKFAGED